MKYFNERGEFLGEIKNGEVFGTVWAWDMEPEDYKIIKR